MSGIDRREFLQFAGGVIVLLSAPPLVAQESGRFSAHPVSDELSAWLNIAEDGTITVYTGKVEVGQNARTSLTQAAADELNVAMESVRLVMGDTDVTPYDMGTFGSRTTPTMVPQIRRAAATAREILQDLASKAWSIDPAAVVVSNGKVLDTQGGRSATFGELTKGKKLVQRVLRKLVRSDAVDRWVRRAFHHPKPPPARRNMNLNLIEALDATLTRFRKCFGDIATLYYPWSPDD